MTTETSKSLGSWKCEGYDSDGGYERVEYRVEANPEWTPRTADAHYRYLLIIDADGEEENEGYDALAPALAAAESYATTQREEYAEIQQTGRECLAEELMTAADDLPCDADGDDYQLCEALAEVLRTNRSAEALAALAAAGLV